MERQALKKEKDPASKERLEKLERELAELKEKSSALKAEWQKEKAVVDEQRKWKEELEKSRTELEQAQRRGDLAKASEIQYGRIPELERKLVATEGAQNESGSAGVPPESSGGSSTSAPREARASFLNTKPRRLLREEVTDEDIAEVVASWTGIPVS